MRKCILCLKKCLLMVGMCCFSVLFFFLLRLQGHSIYRHAFRSDITSPQHPLRRSVISQQNITQQDPKHIVYFTGYTVTIRGVPRLCHMEGNYLKYCGYTIIITPLHWTSTRSKQYRKYKFIVIFKPPLSPIVISSR